MHAVLYHPVYNTQDLHSVKVLTHENKTLSDKFAAGLVKLFRRGFDIVTGYKHTDPKAVLDATSDKAKAQMSLQDMRKKGLVMDEKQWLSVGAPRRLPSALHMY